MKPAYIYIGLAALAATFIGLYFAGSVKLKRVNERLSDLNAYAAFLEDQTEDMEKTILTDKKTIAKFQLRESIYIDKIKVDSLLLKEVKQSNERIDSITSDWNLDDWNKFITADFEDEISEN